jgi:DNA-binding NarL/FixJ family response regulator
MPYLGDEALAAQCVRNHKAAIAAEGHYRKRDESVRELHDRGWSNQRIADLLEVSEGTIRRILRGSVDA